MSLWHCTSFLLAFLVDQSLMYCFLLCARKVNSHPRNLKSIHASELLAKHCDSLLKKSSKLGGDAEVCFVHFPPLFHCVLVFNFSFIVFLVFPKCLSSFSFFSFYLFMFTSSFFPFLCRLFFSFIFFLSTCFLVHFFLRFMFVFYSACYFLLAIFYFFSD